MSIPPNSNKKTKDPNAVLDYAISWVNWLGASETISSSTWVIDSGITKDSDSSDSTTATVWLSGGEVGATYTVTNRIVTNQNRTNDRSLLITIQDL